MPDDQVAALQMSAVIVNHFPGMGSVEIDGFCGSGWFDRDLALFLWPFELLIFFFDALIDFC